MKIPLFLIPLTSVAALNPREPLHTERLHARQFDLAGALGGLFNPANFMPSLKIARVEELKPTIRPGHAKRIRIHWGPVSLQAANETKPLPGVSSLLPTFSLPDTQWNMLMPGLPPRAALLWAKLDLYYQNGSRATSDQGVYLHHIQIHNLDAKRVRKAYCFGEWASMGRPTEIFLSAGASDYEPGFYFTDPAGKLNSGYLTGDEKERYLMNGEVVNYRNERIEVYPTVEIEYMPSIPKGCMESTIMLFSVTGCTAQNPTLELLPGPGVKAWNITSDPFPLPEEGLILNALGHIHDGGTRVESFLNGKPVCDSKAIYGNPATAVHDHLGDNQETVVSMTECSDIIPVKKGDAIKLVAHYDLNKHPARAMAGEHSHEMMSQMGVQTMYFAAKKPSSIVNWSPELGGDVASAPVVAPAAAGPVAPAPRPAADDDAEEDDDRRSRRE